MIDFQFIKEETQDDLIKRYYYGSSYQGGILLRTTVIYQGSVSETITDLPMCEMYKKEDGSLDVRRMNFCMQQVGVDLGFDMGEPKEDISDVIMKNVPKIPECEYPPEYTAEVLLNSQEDTDDNNSPSKSI